MTPAQERKSCLHALLDGDLDAGHARDVEAHIAACLGRASQLREYRVLHHAMSAVDLGVAAPLSSRNRIEAALPSGRAAPSRRRVRRGFAMVPMVSAAAAATVMFAIVRSDQDQRMFSEVISAHLRSLQAEAPHRRGNQRPTHGEALVQRQARRRSARGRPDRAGLHAARRRPRSHRRRRCRRRHRLSPPEHVINLFIVPGAGLRIASKIETVQGSTSDAGPSKGGNSGL